MNRKNFDVVIIGAGSIGAPAAFFLAQEGIRTLAIDKLPSVGQGANKAAIGGIRATHSDKAKISICLKSIEIFSTWQEEYGDHIGWVQGGYSFVAYREQDEETLKGLLEVQKQYGLNINWLDRDELLEVIPDLNSEGLRGGTFCPDDGSACPLLATHAFYRRARERGGEFHFDEEVTDIVVKAGRVRGVETTKGQYGTDFVINAAGPWAKRVANMAGLDVPVRSDCHEAGITEPAPIASGGVVDAVPPGIPLKQLEMWEEMIAEEDKDPFSMKQLTLCGVRVAPQSPCCSADYASVIPAPLV